MTPNSADLNQIASAK